jgi:uncharacterized protein (DUF1501 family)
MRYHQNDDLNPEKLPFFSRRNFLKFSGGCAALSSTSILSTLLDLRLTKAAMAAGGDLTGYKALVCVFLHGGIDSFNMLVPYEDQEYTDYTTVRSNLAIPKASLLMIQDRHLRRFGIHPAMPEIKTLYDGGKLAFVANLGSLVVPTTKANYNSVPKPVGLYSHSDLIQHWQTSIPQSRTQVTGWAGRMADMVTDRVNHTSAISMNISLSGLNILETGQVVIPYTIGTGGATVLSGYSKTTTTPRDRLFTRYTDSVLAETYGNLLERSYAGVRRGAIDGAAMFNAATSSTTLQTVFPNTTLGNQLRMVARAIANRGNDKSLAPVPGKLNVGRQIFFVVIGGWDHHSDLINAQNNQLPVVSQALKAFYDATVELGVADKVTTFTASDFARTLNSNGVGSDHAWGGNHMVMGGAVQGRHVYGTYPSTLAPGNILDMGRGSLIPTTSVDSYNAELALWFGLNNDSYLEAVLPNVRNFYQASNQNMPIGFLQPPGAA